MSFLALGIAVGAVVTVTVVAGVAGGAVAGLTAQGDGSTLACTLNTNNTINPDSTADLSSVADANSATSTRSTTGHGTAAISAAGVAGYGPAQMANAATIVAVGKQMNVPRQGWVIAIAAAMQESRLNNVNHGDRDSLGLFQERPSQGWGSPTQIMNPTYSATQFYQHLLAVPDWQQMSVDHAAQAVEHSAFPDAYAQHEQAAWEVVDAVQGVTCSVSNTPPNALARCAAAPSPQQQGAREPHSNPALVAVEFACAQLGKPYVWGGNGDTGFDCSGLTHAAYAAAGIAIPRTAQTQYGAGPLLPTGTPLQPGDLVFYGSGPQSVTHVGIAISPTQMIDAPHTDADVEITGVGGYLAASRPAANVGSDARGVVGLQS